MIIFKASQGAGVVITIPRILSLCFERDQVIFMKVENDNIHTSFNAS